MRAKMFAAGVLAAVGAAAGVPAGFIPPAYGACAPYTMHSVPVRAMSDHDVQTWLADNGKSLILDQVAHVFPAVEAAKRGQYAYGRIKQISVIVRGAQDPAVAFRGGDSWAVPILDPLHNPVAVSVIKNSHGKPMLTHSFADDTLAGELLVMRDSAKLFYDPQLKGWFKESNESVEAADTDAQNVLLGALPVKNFLLQRQVIISGGKDANSVVAETMPAGAQEQNFSFVQQLLIAATILAVLGVSVIWLLSERKYVRTGTKNVHGRGFGQSHWNIVEHVTRRGKLKVLKNIPNVKEKDEVSDD